MKRALALLLLLLVAVGQSSAALTAFVQWEVNSGAAGASDTNGGGFDAVSGTPGTDYTQGAGLATISYTDIVIGATTTQGTSVARPFVAADVGNIIDITAGTGFTTGRYQVMSVSGGTATFDRSLGTTGSTGGTGILGGSLATPGMASGVVVNGNTIWVKAAAVYTTTSTTANVSGGVVGFTADAKMSGYSTTRGDGGRFTLRCGAALGTILFSGNGSANGSKIISNAIADGNSVASTKGFQGAGCKFINCQGINCAIDGWDAGFYLENCYSSPTAFSCSNCTFVNCFGAITGNQITAIRCIAYNITGRGFTCGFDGFFDGCAAISCTQDGFYDNGNTRSQRFVNCIAVSNGGYGINITNKYPCIDAVNCAFYNNTSGAVHNLANNFSAITMTGSPFNNPATGDFGINNTANQGALLRGLSVPGAWNGPSSTTSYADIGPIQHQDSGGGGGSSGGRIIGGGELLFLLGALLLIRRAFSG